MRPGPKHEPPRACARPGASIQVARGAESGLFVGAGREGRSFRTLVGCAGDRAGCGGRHVEPRHRQHDAGARASIAPGPNTYINFLDEARVGVYAHNWIHDEGSPVDVSGELLSTPIGYASNIGGPWFSWFFNPRINLGAMINTGGKTSYGFTGLTWRIPIYQRFFFEGEFGAAVNTSPLRDEPDRVNTGCRWDFRESGGFGYQFDEHWDMIANIEHISHASCAPISTRA